MSDLNTCIILNGPPSCGKDTLAWLFASEGYIHLSFKSPLYEETARYFGVSLKTVIELCSDRDTKEVPHDAFILHGIPVSPREALIFTSESYIKPRFGSNYFGLKMAELCENCEYEFTVFSDGGFYEEIEEIARIYKQVFLVRLHRQNCSFVNDSRSYIYVPVGDYPGLLTYDFFVVENDIEANFNNLKKMIRGIYTCV